MLNDNSGCLNEWPHPKKSKKEHVLKTPGWECLPTVILDNVFQYLSFKDIINASSTCHNWRQCLYHPRSWQNVTFVIEPDTLPQVQYLRTMVSHLVTNATIKFHSMIASCVTEFLLLLEHFTFNNNLKSLILEPSHCHILTPDSMIKSVDTLPVCETLLKIYSQRPMTQISIGGNEDMSYYISHILEHLAYGKPGKVTMLGFATVKEDPQNYVIYEFDPSLLLPFQNLQILSVDYDNLCDMLLESLQHVKNLQRLVVHLHGINEDHPGTSEESWQMFRIQQPNCLLRLTLIHAFDEVLQLHDEILRDNMPLSHLKVLFCEKMNQLALEKLIHYTDTFVSLMWVDSLCTDDRRALIKDTIDEEARPQNLILLAWLCKNIEEITILGYKYYEVDWIGVARLLSKTLKKLVIAKSDIIETGYDCKLNAVMGKSWAPLDENDLHPVFQDPSIGDSDEYLMPILLADLY